MNEADVENLMLDEDDEQNILAIEQPENIPHLDEEFHPHHQVWFDHEQVEHLDAPDFNNVMAATVAEFYNPPLDYEGCRYNYQPELPEQ